MDLYREQRLKDSRAGVVEDWERGTSEYMGALEGDSGGKADHGIQAGGGARQSQVLNKWTYTVHPKVMMVKR